MGEPTKKPENALRNIANIPAFVSKKMTVLLKELDRQKKLIEEAFIQLAAKKEIIASEIQIRLERQLERERLEKEKEEAIKKAVSKPIIEKEEEEIAPLPKEEPEEKPEAVEPPPAKEEVAVSEESVADEAAEAALESERKKAEAHAAIIAPIFEKPKAKVVEKPVIRIYVPPEDNNRPYKRYNRDGASAPRTDSQRPSTSPRPQRPMQSTERPSGGGMPNRFGGASAPTPPAPSRGGRKRGGDFKVYSQTADAKKSLSRKALSKKGYVIDTSSIIEYDDFSGEVKKVRSRKMGGDKKKAAFVQPTTTVIESAVINKPHITIKELSEKIGKTGVEIIKQLFLLGIIKTINDTIDFDTADLVASELGIKLELQLIETSEEKMIAYHDFEEEEDSGNLLSRPPVVTIMGHVDHGKTSILDYIRKSNVASGEAGGITQHIGAHSIVANGSYITFLDTPGHEAFTAMRARGANVTDIAIIVVAADDGIMPQTIEAINHARAAEVSIIVAVNKMDKPTADPDIILTQLTKHGIVPEEWGGDTPVVRVSAKTGLGIPELLDTILITAEVMELKANPARQARGAVVEARLDKGKGPVATVLVQNGTLKLSDFVVVGSVSGKIRAMHDSTGKAVKEAGPSTAVSVLGLSEVPSAGDRLMVVENEKTMKQIADERVAREQESRIISPKVTLDDVFKGIAEGKLKSLNIIIKADVQGSVEAIKESLIKLSNDEVKVSVVHAVAGAINESDVMLADTTGSIIIGFNVRPDNNAKALADKNGIDIRLYRVIYDAIDDVEQAIKGLLAPKFREQYLGKAEIRVVYKISSIGSIAGCMVKDGKIVRNAKARLLRDNIVISETAIASLRRVKDDVKEVLAGFECGIGLHNFNDLKEGDIIESFNIVEEAQ